MVKKFNQFIMNENSQQNLEMWKKLIDERDLYIFREFNQLTKIDIEQIREQWKVYRRFALSRLNDELNKSGHSGQLFSIDVEDSDLYPYLKTESDKYLFFKYSRILDFYDGYKPKNLLLIKK